MSSFKIYVDRLKDGHTQSIKEQISPDFLEIQEKELKFPSPIEIEGKAYLADDHLVIQLYLTTKASMPCTICNQEYLFPIVIESFYHIEPISSIQGHIFDYTALLREEILLQLPPFVECHQGNCPERSTLEAFLRKKEKTPVDATYHPFADL